MKSVLISIQPKWCELISNGKKTIEVRKTRPNIETPFKCYIYCTHNNRKNAWHIYINSGYGRKKFGAIGNWRSGKDVVDVNSHLPAYRYNAYLAEGKVIGEFVCDEVDTYSYDYSDGVDIDDDSLLYTMLERDEINCYAKGKNTYGWHISNLKIYDKPKELCEFLCKCNKKYCTGCEDFCDEGETSFRMCGGLKVVTRPPQSWCYVEKLEEEK